MALPTLGPCTPWVDAADVFACGPCASIADADQDDALAARAAAAASQLLFYASGQRFPGECETTVRPCAQRSGTSWSWAVEGTSYATRTLCTCASNRCACGALDEITLGGKPIREVEEVKVDGDVLVEGTHYRVDDWRYLSRIDGEGWPCCQDDALPDTEPNTFSVTFTYGQDPPELGVFAAQHLACDIYKGCQGDECKVDERVTNMVRQNTSFTFVSPGDLGIVQGRWKTGLKTVDLFLAQFGRRRRGYVASPDVGPRVRRTGT